MIEHSVRTNRTQCFSQTELLQVLEEIPNEQPIEIHTIAPKETDNTDLDDYQSDDEHQGHLKCMGPRKLKTV